MMAIRTKFMVKWIYFNFFKIYLNEKNTLTSYYKNNIGKFYRIIEKDMDVIIDNIE